MKMELRIESKILIIEAEGIISLEMREAVTAEEEKPSLRLLPALEPEKAPESPDLFKKLAELRRELSAEAGVPPYVVFNDKTLREMAEKVPADLSEFSKIGGVGQAKLEKYGARFLAVIKGAA